MMDKVHWLLPEGIDEVVPPQAARLEQVRRELLDLFSTWGYDLVMPPFIEFLDSLLMGAGADVDLKTFKLVDQVSGRLMGFRADMTTQVARIDAHHLEHDAPARLCYMGTVLHALQDGFGGPRQMLQIGAELYGHTGFESDVEIISLMLESLSLVGVDNISIDIGHVGIFRGLTRQAGLDCDQENCLFDALQRKAVTEIAQYLEAFGVNKTIAGQILALSDLNGSDVLDEARRVLEGASDEVLQAVETVAQVASAIRTAYPALELHYDLSELRGYKFHTGIVFSAYVPDSGIEIARGGRYDNIGGEFGRARPATGFSTDLKKLLACSSRDLSSGQPVVFAPCADHYTGEQRIQLINAVSHLRKQGQRVICELKGQSGSPLDLGCDQLLSYQDGQWQAIPINR